MIRGHCLPIQDCTRTCEVILWLLWILRGGGKLESPTHSPNTSAKRKSKRCRELHKTTFSNSNMSNNFKQGMHAAFDNQSSTLYWLVKHQLASTRNSLFSQQVRKLQDSKQESILWQSQTPRHPAATGSMRKGLTWCLLLPPTRLEPKRPVGATRLCHAGLSRPDVEDVQPSNPPSQGPVRASVS